MTVQCGACGAENRDAAKFCKGCGRKIAQAWPQAAATPLMVGAADASPLLGARGAIPAPAVVPTPPAFEELEPAPVPVRPRIGNGRWIAGLAAGVLVLVVVAAWWGRNNRGQEIPEPPALPAAATPAAAPAPSPATEPVPAPAAASVAPPAAEPAASTAAPLPPLELADRPEPVPAASPAAGAATKQRKPVARKQAAPAPAPVAETVAPAPPPPAPEPARVPTPQEACAGRNFIARAQCMAAQCARPDLASHPHCEPVRRQQQLEEEKRNPTMAG